MAYLVSGLAGLAVGAVIWFVGAVWIRRAKPLFPHVKYVNRPFDS